MGLSKDASSLGGGVSLISTSASVKAHSTCRTVNIPPTGCSILWHLHICLYEWLCSELQQPMAGDYTRVFSERSLSGAGVFTIFLFKALSAFPLLFLLQTSLSCGYP